MLRALANNLVLSYSLGALPDDGPIERLHRLAPVCQSTSSSLGVKILVLWFSFVSYTNTWLHLKDALLDGDNAFKKAHGMTLFEFLGTNIRFSKVFNDALSNYSTITMKKMLENYNGFDGLSTLIDIGGGTGQTFNKIITKYPTIRGVNFDFAHVIKDAPKYDSIN
ncbi:hypothetical protein Cgig2_029636 [Carnegiea gigantea]|uniref:O-methyltransferase C-terminal domain-containing protein n=1 Tax=Carnegiea gigantea TaxID=171969 RepID=A0A9Q1QJF3_9CARY|nr:hypothetical protein Cgig2_029636 [Carnegiea gigantea]